MGPQAQAEQRRLQRSDSSLGPHCTCWLFSCGPPRLACCPGCRTSKKSKGFALVQYADAQDAVKAHAGAAARRGVATVRLLLLLLDGSALSPLHAHKCSLLSCHRPPACRAGWQHLHGAAHPHPARQAPAAAARCRRRRR